MSELLPLMILIIEKNGNIKEMEIKNFKEEELFKKCGFKKSEDFLKHHEWNIKMDGIKYSILMYGKIDGRANSENKYDFPPPIDNKLFFGNCALVAKIRKDDNKNNYTNLSMSLWNKMYEKLFGGFEDLTTNAVEDEEEEDELANVPKNKKTKHGYLKDGFVVDSDGDRDDDSNEDSSYNDDSDDLGETDSSEENEPEADITLEDIGSELSEDEYDYDD
jgi:hypothetical protein